MRLSLHTLSALAALALPGTLTAQRRSNYNEAWLVPALSPAALGLPVGITVGLSAVSRGALIIGDVSLGNGALRLMAGRSHRVEAYGLGYGQALLAHPLTPWSRISLGADATVGYYSTQLPEFSRYVGNPTSLNAHLGIPVAVRLGSERWSLTPYLAPYAEIGEGPDGYWSPQGCNPTNNGTQQCNQFIYSGHYETRSVGSALGVRLTAWRLALEVAHGELPGARRYSSSSAVISVRF